MLTKRTVALKRSHATQVYDFPFALQNGYVEPTTSVFGIFHGGRNLPRTTYFMRINAYISPIIKILLWVIFAISVVSVVFAVLAVCNVPNVFQLSRANGIVLLSSMPVIAVFSACVATVHYKLDSTHLRLKIAFWDILGGKIRTENILNIVYTDGKMYVSYLWKGFDPTISQIAIKPKHFDKMKDALLAKNPNIVFYNDKSNEGDK